VSIVQKKHAFSNINTLGIQSNHQALTLRCPVMTTCTTRSPALRTLRFTTQYIYAFCMDLRKHSDYLLIQT